MRGLRVYVHRAGAHGERGVFYSRRADGPYYCWRYEETQGDWCFFRVRPSRFMLKALSVARWKAVPTALQLRLVEHYLE